MPKHHDDVEAAFEDHFLRTFDTERNPAGADIHLGADFSTYEPYYQFGYEHALDEAFEGRTYAEASPELRQRFAHRYPTTSYDVFEGAIRFAYEETRRAAR